ncbi:MAG TPA: nicotinate (nicotinamide) nucleotide adenylyltransferase [Candidatus Polarisedimenticolaceae bacterium]|nr:nicotinate (nicotinamide) nucleotide adenylyltransferase [Candidatus Polarisedimenticolaceae bacterium]
MTGTLGILGGTFDPVHRGHLALASAARDALGLPTVALLPSAVPPHKPDRRIAPAYERLEMLFLAVEGRPGLTVATDELRRGGTCFTIDTLRSLRSAGVAPVFLVGGDALAEIETWREHAALLAEFDLAVVERRPVAGVETEAPWPESVRARLTPLPFSDGSPPLGAGGRIVRLAVELPAVSSRQVRARVAAEAPLDDLVPGRVARYIQLRRLYRQEATR